jgi:hypothetical protein
MIDLRRNWLRIYRLTNCALAVGNVRADADFEQRNWLRGLYNKSSGRKPQTARLPPLIGISVRRLGIMKPTDDLYSVIAAESHLPPNAARWSFAVERAAARKAWKSS